MRSFFTAHFSAVHATQFAPAVSHTIRTLKVPRYPGIFALDVLFRVGSTYPTSNLALRGWLL